MLRHTVRVGRVVVGVALLVVGIVLALPFVPGPGIPIAFVGLTLLGYEFEWARRLRSRAHEEFARRVGRKDAG
jgi:hypothetical protein